MRTLALLTLTLAACSPKRVPADAIAADPSPPPQAACPDATFTVLHLNDIYRIEGLADGRGGLDRVRTLRSQLEQCGPVLVTHAGDAFFPSLLSLQYQGRQMVDVLNGLDGDFSAFDAKMVATFGNHEFDKSKLKYAPFVDELLDNSQFAWLDTNITWAKGDDGAPLIAAEHLQHELIVELGGKKVGLFSLTLDMAVPAYVSAIDRHDADLARAKTAALRAAGADVVIALTHLDAREDTALLRALGDDGPDLVLGGHDHAAMELDVDGRYVLKGAADATAVQVISVQFADEAPHFAFPPGGVALGPDTVAQDPAVRARIDDWLARFEQDWCGDKGPGCLDTVLTTARTDVHAEELTIRRFETDLGDWVTDQMLSVFADQGSQGAILNSGSLRLNQDISAGTPITTQIVQELMPYPTGLYLIELKGSELQQVLEHSVADWTGSGHWLQVAGIAFRHDPDAGTVTDLTLLTPQGPRPIRPDETLRLVSGSYILDASVGDQDGYGALLSMDRVVDVPANNTELKDIVRAGLEATRADGLAVALDGRICNPQRPGPCLAVAP